MVVDSSVSRVGTRFGAYELRSLLGEGGMGEVYEAYDTGKDRTVALKLLSDRLAKNPTYQERFRRESHAAARLQEPHVIPIHDWGEIDGTLYIDMRLVPGRDLRALLKNYGPMTPARAVTIVSQIASALDAAHADALIHRDIKPENVLVTHGNDFAYLVDFGIAHSGADSQLTELGTAIGSYGYMAPERFDKDPVTNRADIYSLACVLNECLTGMPPFPVATVSQLIKAHLTTSPPRPSMTRPGVPAAFDGVISRGMAKRPEDRFATAGDLARAARDALTGPQQDEATAMIRRAADATTVNPVGDVPEYQPTMVRPVAEMSTGAGGAVPFSSVPYMSVPYGSVPYMSVPYGSVPYGSVPYGAPPPVKKSTAMPVLLTLLVVALLAIGGVVAWLVISESKSDTAASAPTSSTLPASPAAIAPAAPAPVTALPSEAQPCSSVFGTTGAYRTSAAGNDVTSCPFSEEVRRAYAASGSPTPQPRSVVATSPVTGLTYTMTCTANGALATCTGGDGAVVYVY
nr:serine/threonine-protein kinase [Spelaeibacter cavernicola]